MKSYKKYCIKRTVLLGTMMLVALFFSLTAHAGWEIINKKSNKIVYTDTDGNRLTGFQTIGSGVYYFDEKGILQTGWTDTPEGRRYFLEKGKTGKKLGRMAVSQWVDDHKYYVDADGSILKNTVTSDGYVLKSNGKVKKKLKQSQFVKLSGNRYFYKKKTGILKDQVFKYKKNYYYVDAEGIRRTGWVTWGGHDYYFGSGGKAVTGVKNIGGQDYVFNKQGQLLDEEDISGTAEVTGKASILIVCGHGQGDPGAVGCNNAYVESKYTRDFGRRIYKALGKYDTVSVTLFNTNYNMYEQMKTVIGSVGSFTGSGKKKKAILSAIKKSSVLPLPTKYDYVLEIHFNATVESAKDPGGNGKKKGCGCYVNAYKSSKKRKIDRKIIKALNSCGLNTWGKGVYGSAKLLNARVHNEVGVNYSLLETCFIDDKDDMKFYRKKKDTMAYNVAKAIVNYFK